MNPRVAMGLLGWWCEWRALKVACLVLKSDFLGGRIYMLACMTYPTARRRSYNSGQKQAFQGVHRGHGVAGMCFRCTTSDT